MRSCVLIFISLFAVSLIAGAQDQVQITKGPAVEHTDNTSAVIAWSTNVNAGTNVKYGTDPSALTQNATMPWGGITHRVTIRNLKPNTTYYFQAVSGQGQGSGTEAVSGISQFQTVPSGSGPQAASAATTQMAPSPVRVAAGPIPQRITSTSAAIWWQVGQAAPLSVRFGTSPTALTSIAPTAKNAGRYGHEVKLENLEPSTDYYVALVDAAGNQVATSEFKTFPSNYSPEKVRISNGPVVEFIGDRDAVIAWSTAQKSASVVRYGTDPNNLTQVAEPSTEDATQRVHLSNLQPNTKYWFAIQPVQTTNANAAPQSLRYPIQTVSNASAALKLDTQP